MEQIGDEMHPGVPPAPPVQIWISGKLRCQQYRQLRRPYSSQIRSPQSHSNARMTSCLSGKCTVLTNFSVAPQTRHSRFESLSISPILSALNISISAPSCETESERAAAAKQREIEQLLKELAGD